MAYVHPKCPHGRLAIQLFYHNSYVCPDECSKKPKPSSLDWGSLEQYMKSTQRFKKCFKK